MRRIQQGKWGFTYVSGSRRMTVDTFRSVQSDMQYISVQDVSGDSITITREEIPHLIEMLQAAMKDMKGVSDGT